MQKREKSEPELIRNIIPAVLKSISERVKAKEGEKTHERPAYIST